MEIQKFKNGNKELKIIQDEDPESPREWDNLGIMFCFHKKYNLGDKNNLNSDNFGSWNEIEENLIKEEKAILIKPLFLYDHSGISIKIGSFNGLVPGGHAKFDSGQVGFIYTTKEKIKECYGIKKVTKNILNKAEECLKGEIETYDQYLRGDNYGFELIEITKCKECGEIKENIIDSCWGFYGSDINTNGIKEHIDIKGFKEVV